jgi:hypothetical protein
LLRSRCTVTRAADLGQLAVAKALQRHARRRQRVAELVGDEAQVLGRLAVQLLIPPLDVLGERVGDARVEPAGDHLLLLQRDRDAGVTRDLQDALVQQAVFAHHLTDVEVQAQALGTVLLGVVARGRQRDGVRVQRGDDLIDERRDPVQQLRVRDRRVHQRADLRAPAGDQQLASCLEDAEQRVLDSRIHT